MSVSSSFSCKGGGAVGLMNTNSRMILHPGGLIQVECENGKLIITPREVMAKIIVLGAVKGGVGKSVSTYNLA